MLLKPFRVAGIALLTEHYLIAVISYFPIGMVLDSLKAIELGMGLIDQAEHEVLNLVGNANRELYLSEKDAFRNVRSNLNIAEKHRAYRNLLETIVCTGNLNDTVVSVRHADKTTQDVYILVGYAVPKLHAYFAVRSNLIVVPDFFA